MSIASRAHDLDRVALTFMRWTVRAQVINAVLTLRTMHQDARDVLVSEIVCDTMYAIFFGGFRFTYNHQKSGQTICAQTSPIVDIVHEIKHRLGYLPELAKTEGSQRHLILLLTTNNLAYYGQKCDEAVYNMRTTITFPTLGDENPCARQLRIFKNSTRVHHANTRRLIDAQHRTYKRTVFRFFEDVVDSAAYLCGSWLCRESEEISRDTQQLVVSLHQQVDALEKMAR